MSNLLKVPSRKVLGRVVEWRGKQSLFLSPAGDESHVVYLRFALTELGTERPLWPALILDDWGNEIRGMKLYRWVRQRGFSFPRAEIFGFDHKGAEIQWFVRELEMVARHAVRAYQSRDDALLDGVRVRRVVWLDAAWGERDPAKLERPLPEKLLAQLKDPLPQARVEWWRMGVEGV